VSWKNVSRGARIVLTYDCKNASYEPNTHAVTIVTQLTGQVKIM